MTTLPTTPTRERPFVKPERFPELILNWFSNSTEELVFISVTDDETSSPDQGIGFSLNEFRAFLNLHSTLTKENARLAERVRVLEGAFDHAIAVAKECRAEWDRAPEGMRAGKLLIALSGDCQGYRADIDEMHIARSALSQKDGETPKQ